MSVKQKIERLEKARDEARQAAIDRWLSLLRPDERVVLRGALEADLAGRPIPADLDEQASAVFRGILATPEEVALWEP